MRRKKVSVASLIELRSRQLKKWVENKPEPIKGLSLRKFICKADHFKVSKDKLTTAVCLSFDLSIPYTNQLWSVPMMMAMHSRGMHLPNGDEFRAGVHFFVKTENGQYQRLRDFRVILDAPGGESDSEIEDWVEYWIQRGLKDPSIKNIFSYKTLVAENLDEVAH